MYQTIIKTTLAKQGFIGKYDPRHIEAYMRIGNSTLDGLSRSEFTREVNECRQCVDADGTANAEGLAISYGL